MQDALTLIALMRARAWVFLFYCLGALLLGQLEDGEVNTQLTKNFMACARREFKLSPVTQVLR